MLVWQVMTLPSYVNGSLKTSACGTLQVLLCLLSGTCFCHAFPTPSPWEIPLAPAPDPTAPIHSFQPTKVFSAFFPCWFCWFSCAIPGRSIPLPRRAGHCLRQPPPSSSCQPHHRAQPHFPELSVSAYTTPPPHPPPQSK